MDRQARTLHFTEWQKRAFFCLSYFFNKIYEHKYFRNKCSVCGTYCTLSRSLCFFTSSLVLQLAQSVQGQWTHNVQNCEQYIASSPAATCQYKLMHSAAASRPRFKTIFCSRISGCYLSWCIYHPVSRFRLQHIGPKNADSWWEFRAQWKKSQDPTQWSADFGAMHTNLVSFTMTRQTQGLDTTPPNAHMSPLKGSARRCKCFLDIAHITPSSLRKAIWATFSTFPDNKILIFCII